MDFTYKHVGLGMIILVSFLTVTMEWIPLCSAPATVVGFTQAKLDSGESIEKSTSTLSTTTTTTTTTTTATTTKAPGIADGCYHVFIDAGSNLGVHGRFLFEPEKYPGNYFAKLFDDHFGQNRKKIPICVFAFEPNPRHREHQLATEKAYNAMGWRYHYIQAAVSDKEDEMTFYRNGHVGEGFAHEEWGFSLVPHGNITEAQAVTVRALDLAQWFKENIQFRKVPTEVDTSLTLGKKPTIMMKMDIESAEFRVLPHLALTGVACLIDSLVGEHHAQFGEPVITRGGDSLLSPAKLDLINAVATVMKAEGCKPLYEYDDESYIHDGQPLPKPR